MMDPAYVVLYLGTPALLLLGGYGLWLSHKVKQSDARRRESAPANTAHHPAE